MYAGDMVLVATSAAGLHAQLGVQACYCERTAIVVNTTKTKVLLLAGARTTAAAVAKVPVAGLTFAGVQLDVVSSSRYLGIMFAMGSR